MALKTEVHTTYDGRWQMITKNENGKFVSSVQLPTDSGFRALDAVLNGLGVPMGETELPYETIKYDNGRWVLTPEGTNAKQYATRAECEADHMRIVVEHFGEEAATLTS